MKVEDVFREINQKLEDGGLLKGMKREDYGLFKADLLDKNVGMWLDSDRELSHYGFQNRVCMHFCVKLIS